MAEDKDRNEQEEMTGEPKAAAGQGQEASVGVPEGDVTESYEALQERLVAKEAEVADYLERMKRAQAEMENYRKRMMKEQEQIVRYAACGVIAEMLPVIDNLERGLDVAERETDAEKLHTGVMLIHAQLHDLLTKLGVEVIDPLGEEFDPQRHEAVMQVESEEHGENAVAEVLQKGYELKGRLLRPAMVKVAR